MTRESQMTGAGLGTRVAKLKTLEGSARSVRPPMPKSAKLEITSRCHMRCSFCAATRRQRACGDITPAVSDMAMGALARAGVEHLGLFYIGEPLLDDGLAQAVRRAKSHYGFPYVFLTTSGVPATPERVRGCMEAGLDSLKFAFNWADPEQFRDITGAPSRYFAEAIENVRQARAIRDAIESRSGHRCALAASSLEYDEAQRSRMAEVLKTIQAAVDEHYWLPLVRNHGVPAPAQRGPCWALFKEAHVTWDGHLSACPLDASPRFHMGDLKAVSFPKAWNSPGFQALRAAHLEGDLAGTVCEKCLAY